MTQIEVERILELARERGALSFGEFRLTSGALSSYYFDGRLLTLDPEGAFRLARLFLPLLWESGAEAVAGPTVGADPIVSSICVMSYVAGRPISGLLVRQEPKQHGAKRSIEGPLTQGARVAVVDDTCSTGGSLLRTVDAMEAAGCTVVKVLCILDRGTGGSDAIRHRGYDFTALLRADERGEIAPAGA